MITMAKTIPYLGPKRLKNHTLWLEAPLTYIGHLENSARSRANNQIVLVEMKLKLTLNFTLTQSCTYRTVLGKFAASFYARTRFLIFSSF